VGVIRWLPIAPSCSRHDRKRLAWILQSSGSCWLLRNILIPSIQFCHQILSSPFNLCRRRFPTKIVFVRLKARRINVLEYIDHRQFFPKARTIWRSPHPTHDNIPVAVIEWRRQRIGNDKLITLDFLYWKGFKAADIKINQSLLHILLFLHANYFQVHNWLMYKSFSNKVVQISCVIVIGMVLCCSFYI